MKQYRGEQIKTDLSKKRFISGSAVVPNLEGAENGCQ
jgi:hypothetical protein